jgi:hypothetical protein
MEAYERKIRRAKRKRKEAQRALMIRKTQIAHREPCERESKVHNRHTNWELVLVKNDTIPTWQGNLR